MKPTTRYLAVVLSSVLLFGCNSSDDDDNTTPVPPPVDDTIGISDTTTLTASMQAASDLEKAKSQCNCWVMATKPSPTPAHLT